MLLEEMCLNDFKKRLDSIAETQLQIGGLMYRMSTGTNFFDTSGRAFQKTEPTLANSCDSSEKTDPNLDNLRRPTSLSAPSVDNTRRISGSTFDSIRHSSGMNIPSCENIRRASGLNAPNYDGNCLKSGINLPTPNSSPRTSSIKGSPVNRPRLKHVSVASRPSSTNGSPVTPRSLKHVTINDDYTDDLDYENLPMLKRVPTNDKDGYTVEVDAESYDQLTIDYLLKYFENLKE